MVTVQNLIERVMADEAVIRERLGDVDTELRRIESKHRNTADESARIDTLRGQRAPLAAQLGTLVKRREDLQAEQAADDAVVASSREVGSVHPQPAAPGVQEHSPIGITGTMQSATTADRAAWRLDDGRVATLPASQRLADHPIARRAAELTAERDRSVAGQHGTFGQLVRSLTTSSASAIVPTVWAANVIDQAAEASAVMQAGAQLVPMDAKTMQIGRVTGLPNADFYSEGGTITPSDPSLDNVTLTARRMSTLVIGSLEWFADANDADAVVTRVIAQAIAERIDLVALYGGLDGSGTPKTGGSGEDLTNAVYPHGVLKALTAKLSANVLGVSATNGTTQTSTKMFDEQIDTVYQVRRGRFEPTGRVMSPNLDQVYAKAYTTDGIPIPEPASLAAVPKYLTTKIGLYKKGTSGTEMTDLFVGDFTNLLIGARLELEVQTLTERYAENGQIGIVAHWRGDIAVARESAFAVFQTLKSAT